MVDQVVCRTAERRRRTGPMRPKTSNRSSVRVPSGRWLTWETPPNRAVQRSRQPLGRRAFWLISLDNLSGDVPGGAETSWPWSHSERASPADVPRTSAEVVHQLCQFGGGRGHFPWKG